VICLALLLLCWIRRVAEFFPVFSSIFSSKLAAIDSCVGSIKIPWGRESNQIKNQLIFWYSNIQMKFIHRLGLLFGSANYFRVWIVSAASAESVIKQKNVQRIRKIRNRKKRYNIQIQIKCEEKYLHAKWMLGGERSFCYNANVKWKNSRREW